jgi:Ca-activated chloride channel family protein
MEGDSIESAKRALHHVLSHLHNEDQFSYSMFGSHVKHEFPNLKPANQLNISAASVLISKTQADMGGTEIEDALLSTFNLKGTDKKADVLLITDGEVWDTSSIIAAAKKSGHRIFAIGVGTSPAETLLRELAEMTGGACELVSPKEDIEKAIIRMFNRIHLPRAKEIEINWGTNETPQWVVGANTAIFSGNTYHVFAGFKNAPIRPAYLSYQLGDSSERIGIGANSITRTEKGNLARLGAAQRLSKMPEEDQLSLALHYQLITAHTNCIMVHVRSAEEKTTGMPELQKIAQMQAAGWGGAGSVYEVAYSSKSMPMYDAIQYSLNTVDSIMPGCSDLRMPRVYRSSRAEADSTDLGGSSIDKKLPSNKDVDNYEIPAFLKRDGGKPTSQIKDDPLLPRDVVSIANDNLIKERNLSLFVREIEEKLFSDELNFVLKKLQNSMNREQAWTIILYWILFKLTDEIEWNEDTKITIETLVSELNPKVFNSGLDVVNLVFKYLSPIRWE